MITETSIVGIHQIQQKSVAKNILKTGILKSEIDIVNIYFFTAWH